MVEKGNIPVDRARYKAKGQPLCMQQYGRLFSTYRVPGLLTDKLRRMPETARPCGRASGGGGVLQQHQQQKQAGEDGEREQQQEDEYQDAPRSDSVLIMRSGKVRARDKVVLIIETA